MNRLLKVDGLDRFPGCEVGDGSSYFQHSVEAYGGESNELKIPMSGIRATIDYYQAPSGQSRREK
jgi:hypothetical protein